MRLIPVIKTLFDYPNQFQVTLETDFHKVIFKYFISVTVGNNDKQLPCFVKVIVVTRETTGASKNFCG